MICWKTESFFFPIRNTGISIEGLLGQELKFCLTTETFFCEKLGQEMNCSRWETFKNQGLTLNSTNPPLGAALSTDDTKMGKTIPALHLTGEVDAENVKKWRVHTMWTLESEPWMESLVQPSLYDLG